MIEKTDWIKIICFAFFTSVFMFVLYFLFVPQIGRYVLVKQINPYTFFYMDTVTGKFYGVSDSPIRRYNDKRAYEKLQKIKQKRNEITRPVSNKEANPFIIEIERPKNENKVRQNGETLADYIKRSKDTTQQQGYSDDDFYNLLKANGDFPTFGTQITPSAETTTQSQELQ